MRRVPLTQAVAQRAACVEYLNALAGDNSAWRRAFRDAFLTAMRQELTARQYQALMLHYVENRSQRDIAAQWGISPSAVCRHIARGRRRLNRLLSYNLEYRAG